MSAWLATCAEVRDHRRLSSDSQEADAVKIECAEAVRAGSSVFDL